MKQDNELRVIFTSDLWMQVVTMKLCKMLHMMEHVIISMLTRSLVWILYTSRYSLLYLYLCVELIMTNVPGIPGKICSALDHWSGAVNDHSFYWPPQLTGRGMCGDHFRVYVYIYLCVCMLYFTVYVIYVCVYACLYVCTSLSLVQSCFNGCYTMILNTFYTTFSSFL